MKSYAKFAPRVGLDERIVSALSYLTSGFFGLVWAIVAGIQKRHVSRYTRFHIYQSFFLSILFYLSAMIFRILYSVVQLIPFVNGVMNQIVFYLIHYEVIFDQSILGLFLFIVIVYLIISVLLGKDGRLLWVSDMVDKML